MDYVRKTALLVCLACAAGAAEPPAPKAPEAAYDTLPDGVPGEVARLFYSALDVPEVAEWLAQDRKDLLDVVTVRYKNRLVDRAPASSSQRTERYVEHLAQSALAQEFPNVVRQTCAQYGMAEGLCVEHRGYVRRALVLEEMLAQQHLTLDQLETELVGATRLKLSDWQAGFPE